MYRYRQVSGFFANRDQAQHALNKLLEKGIMPNQLNVYNTQSIPVSHESFNGGNEVLREALVSGAMGVMAGTIGGMLIESALMTANIHLFAPGALIPPLVFLGWGAAVGGFIGAAMGMQKKPRPLYELVGATMLIGHFALVAETRTKQETISAQEVIKAELGDFGDVRVV